MTIQKRQQCFNKNYFVYCYEKGNTHRILGRRSDTRGIGERRSTDRGTERDVGVE